MIKAVIWDFDGTLFETYSSLVEAFSKALLEDNIIVDKSSVEKQMRKSVIHAIDYYQKKYNITDECLQRFIKFEHELTYKLAAPYPYAKEMCEYIKTNDKYNFLFTHRGDSALYLLNKFKLNIYFTESITANAGFERKPSPGAINYIIKKFSLRNDETLMVGDRDIDILAAVNAGVKSCLFKSHPVCDTNIPYDFMVNSLIQLKDIV